MVATYRVPTAVVVVLLTALTGLTALPAAAAGRPAFSCRELLAADTGPRWYVHGRVDGDLVVDAPCEVGLATVTGDVVVQDQNGLGLFDSTVLGSVRSADGHAMGSVWMSGADVAGDVWVNPQGSLAYSVVRGDLVLRPDPALGPDAARARVEVYSSHVGGDVLGEAPTVEVSESAVVGRYDVTATSVARLRDSVLGSVTARGDSLLLAHDVVTTGSFTAERTLELLLCRGRIGGDLTVHAVRRWSRVGEEGTLYCRTSVTGSLHVLDNPSTVVLGSVRVAGDLVCSNNTGSRGVVRRPVLVVSGTRSPGCA